MIYTRNQIESNLKLDNRWLFRGILAIYERQTDSEQNAGMTRENNGVGFNAFDSEILSSFAMQIRRWEDTPINQRKYGIPLSIKQIEVARKLMKKYVGQLTDIANENERRKEARATAIALDNERRMQFVSQHRTQINNEAYDPEGIDA